MFGLKFRKIDSLYKRDRKSYNLIDLCFIKHSNQAIIIKIVEWAEVESSKGRNATRAWEGGGLTYQAIFGKVHIVEH